MNERERELQQLHTDALQDVFKLERLMSIATHALLCLFIKYTSPTDLEYIHSQLETIAQKSGIKNYSRAWFSALVKAQMTNEALATEFPRNPHVFIYVSELYFTDSIDDTPELIIE